MTSAMDDFLKQCSFDGEADEASSHHCAVIASTKLGPEIRRSLVRVQPAPYERPVVIGHRFSGLLGLGIVRHFVIVRRWYVSGLVHKLAP